MYHLLKVEKTIIGITTMIRHARFVYLFVYLFVCLSVCLSVVCLFTCWIYV